jgi:hypothetical protein
MQSFSKDHFSRTSISRSQQRRPERFAYRVVPCGRFEICKLVLHLHGFPLLSNRSSGIRLEACVQDRVGQIHHLADIIGGPGHAPVYVLSQLSKFLLLLSTLNGEPLAGTRARPSVVPHRGEKRLASFGLGAASNSSHILIQDFDKGHKNFDCACHLRHWSE